MGRSLKKGPFADASLLKKVDEMNKLQAEIDRLTDLKRALENN